MFLCNSPLNCVRADEIMPAYFDGLIQVVRAHPSGVVNYARQTARGTDYRSRLSIATGDDVWFRRDQAAFPHVQALSNRQRMLD
jgi:hypothetical protein